MCTTCRHSYICGHQITEKAPCATSRSASCGVLNTKIVKHSVSCESCDHLDALGTPRPTSSAPHRLAATSERTLESNVLHDERTGWNDNMSAQDEADMDRASNWDVILTSPTFWIWSAGVVSLSALAVLHVLNVSTTSARSQLDRQSDEEGSEHFASDPPGDGNNILNQSTEDVIHILPKEDQQDKRKRTIDNIGCKSNLTTSPMNVDEEDTDSLPSNSDSPSSGVADSTEDEQESSLLDIEKRAIVDRLMESFKNMLHAAVPQRHPKDEGLCTSPVSSASHTRDLTHRVQQSVVEALSSWSLAVRKRGASQQNVTEASHLTTRDRATSSPKILGKRPQRKESYTPSDDEGDESSLKRAKTTFIGDSRNGRKFACPYFKRDPEKYISRRSCVGPGWEEVRRVKEHLYRNHALPHFCPRCYETFKVESLLHDHQRGAEPCAIQPKGLVDGFDKLQEKRLRSRKKTCPNQNEADKWRDMYRILFPDDEDTSIPSPYLEEDWKAIYQRGRPAVTDELARYEQFLRRELPSAVRRELESAVEREFSPVEERLKTQLIDIARDLQLRLFQTYTQSRTAEAPSDRHALDSPRATNPAELATTVSAGELHGASELPSVETEPASLEPLPPVGFSSAYEFDAVLFQFDELQDLGAFEDSSYGSMFADDAFAKDSLDDFSDDFYNGGYDNGEGPSGTC